MSQGTMRGNRKPRVQNSASLLLENSENESLFNILGRGCVTLATGVVQLYTADPPTRQRWSKRHTGVACFIKDNPQRSYFIRVYDMKKLCMIWEQEIYNQFRYKSPREYFHTFEAEDGQAGLNFASEDEAFKFKKAVEEKLLERHQRRMEKKKQSVRANPNRAQPPPSPTAPKTVNSGPPPSSSEVSLNKPASNQLGGGTISKAKTKKDKGSKPKKLTKEDISTPTDFRHVSHVGWDPNKGFDMNSLDPSMKEVFKSVGIDENDAIDEETVDFIYQFVDSHGGLDAIKAEMASRPPPAAPASNPRQASRPPPPPTRQGAPPPPPPQQKSTAPPPPPPNRTGPRSLGAPPPPPPPSSHGFPPPPPPSTNKPMPPAPPPPSSAVPTPPPNFSKPAPPGPGGPPPPPPPPPPSAPAPPPPPPVGGPAVPTPPADSGGRGALLDQIRGGKSLKAVTTNDKPDARDNLLSAIRSGTSLKPVGPQAAEEKPAGTEAQGGIVGALARALANRQKHIQGSDDESDDDEDEVSDDDDWDD